MGDFTDTMRVGLYLHNLDEEYQISVYRGIRDQARFLNIDLVCVQGEKIMSPRPPGGDYFPSRHYLHVDGVMLLSPVLIDRADVLSSIHLRGLFETVPCISIGNRLSDLTSIIIRCRESMEAIMEHLVDFHGYRRLLYIGGPPNHWDNIVRENVFRRFINCRQKNLPEISAEVRHGGFHEFSGMAVMREYIDTHIDEPLDAVVAANDNMAIGVIKALQTHGNPRWRHCAVTGFDDIPQAELEEPALTTIRQPLETMGRQAVQTLYDMIAGRKTESVIRVDSNPLIRNSCGCPVTQSAGLPQSEQTALHERIAEIQYKSIRSEQQLRTVSFLGQRLITVETINEGILHLQQFLDNLEIMNFFVMLFLQPSTSVDRTALLVYERRKGISAITPTIAPKVELAEFFTTLGLSAENNAERHDPTAYCIYHLRSGSEYLGLIVYEAPDDVHPYICSGAIFFANTVKRLHLMADEKERNRQLEMQVALRTQDLVEINEKLKREAARRLVVEAEVLKISEMERLRFSLDLHDDICQRLAGISMYCKGISSINQVGELSLMLDETLSLTRRYAHAAFPMELDNLGLDKALEALCREVENQTGRACLYTWEAALGASPLTRAQDINIYRIVQEALHNAVTHSGAAVIEVSLRQEANILIIRVKDDGVGNPTLGAETIKIETGGRKRGGLGLRSMQYRAHQLGAEYIFASSETEGTLVELRVPFNSPNQTSSSASA